MAGTESGIAFQCRAVYGAAWRVHVGQGKARKMSSTHTTFYRGRKIRVVLRDGTCMKCKFVDSTSKDIVVEVDGRTQHIPKKQLKSCTIWRDMK